MERSDGRWRGQAGFTFAELALVLVFVVGLLVVATVSVRNIRHETSSSNCQTQLRTLKLATERYHAVNQAYPVDKSVLVDGGLVTASEVADWTVDFASAATEPTYRAADDGPCTGTAKTS
ncbi:hypothetical protein KSP35_14325 [Aquihabitans sp. G128]|uniref:hypothetical protein n=1 Tax=Aquihabitans sp. G128 TaxID=2849779 RepID=UPI001C2128EC|nr:hypothetical protein [Aquihabitans sp. G128]QXC59559.1 hypothetical protein KSP35_14325 [Aquihabitans sp. G128]